MTWLAILLCLAPEGALQAATLPVEPVGVARQEDARAQLKFAGEAKHRMRGTRGVERRNARLRAVEAYRAVRQYHPRERAVVSESCFRAGELLRSAGSTDAAIVEFEHAQDYGRACLFRPRAGLELGHIYRRLGRSMDALSAYEAVEAMGSEFPEQRDLAAYWQGKVQLILQRPADARRAFERAARKGVEPLRRIRAFDAWADILIEARDLEGAAGVLDLCTRSLAEHAAELSTLGVRVRATLESMGAPAKLARAIKKRGRYGGGVARALNSFRTNETPSISDLTACRGRGVHHLGHGS